MARLGILFFLAFLAVLVFALIDCLSTDEAEIRTLPKAVWIGVILLFSPVGGIAWFMTGRPSRETAAGTRRSGAGFPKPRLRQLAPDDDPNFLRSLDERDQEAETLRRWEEELRKPNTDE